jgi:hypothetical protein
MNPFGVPAARTPVDCARAELGARPQDASKPAASAKPAIKQTVRPINARLEPLEPKL